MLAKTTQALLDRNGATIRPVTHQDYMDQLKNGEYITDAMRNADSILSFKGREYFVRSTYSEVSRLLSFIKKYYVS